MLVAVIMMKIITSNLILNGLIQMPLKVCKSFEFEEFWEQ